MNRKKSIGGQRSVMEILMDPLFGLLGALIVVFMMQIIATINMVDSDLIKVIEDTSAKNRRLMSVQVKYDAQQNLVETLQDEIDRDEEKIDKLEWNLRKKEREAAEYMAQMKQLEEDMKKLMGGQEISADDNREIERLRAEILRLRLQANKELKVSPLRINTMKLPPALKGASYMLTLSAEGGQPPYEWILLGSLPEGLEFNGKRGLIHGSTNKAGAGSFTVSVRDSSGAKDDRELILDIKAAGGVEGLQSWKEKIPSWLIIVGFGILLLLLGMFIYSLWESRNYNFYKERKPDRIS